MDNTNYKIALLIDAENVPVNRMSAVIKEMAKYGRAITSRFYADIKAVGEDWRRISSEYAIRPVHQYNVAVKKNAADMAMSLDALEIMNEGLVNMFILVTSDSDFTPLVIKLREKGAFVIGIGDQKASKAFVSSCNEFKYFNYLVDEKKNNGDTDDDTIETKELANTIKSLIIESGTDGRILLSQLGILLTNLQSDFDPRRYGARNLSKLVSAIKTLALVKEKDQHYVKLIESGTDQDIAGFIIKKIKARPTKRIALPEIIKMLKAQFKDFDYENYGYSKFGKFIDSLNGLDVDNNAVVLSQELDKTTNK
ncbi:MAG TPA: NYN domain-containing protein [Bacilli bacterium]|nr:NYN domain-containing protein [Bacilli bacterium]